MRKKLFWTAIGGTIAGLVNMIVFIVMTHFQMVAARSLAYVFIVGHFAAAWAPFLVAIIFKVKFSLPLAILYQVFMFLAILLGSLWGFYGRFPLFYDKLIHFASGVLVAYLTYDIFRSSKKSVLSGFWLFMLVMSVSMFFGSLWEIYEFTTDVLLKNNALGTIGKTGIDAILNTMIDLVCDLLGAIVGATLIILQKHYQDKKAKLREPRNEQESDKTKA